MLRSRWQKKKKKKKLGVQQVLPEISLQPSDCEFVALEMTLCHLNILILSNVLSDRIWKHGAPYTKHETN